MAGISNISSSYQVQGSSTAQTSSESISTASVSAAAETEKVSPVTIKEDTGRKSEDESKGEEYTPSNEALKEAVKVINSKLGDSKAVFGVHEATKKLTIKIVDKDTDKVRKEYPVEETLDALARLWDSAGIMVDEKR